MLSRVHLISVEPGSGKALLALFFIQQCCDSDSFNYLREAWKGNGALIYDFPEVPR